MLCLLSAALLSQHCDFHKRRFTSYYAALTVTATVAVKEPLVAVIVVEPTATAVIVPSAATVATPVLLDANLAALTTSLASDASTGSADTVICLVAPTFRDAVF